MFDKFWHHLKYLLFDQRLTQQNSERKIKLKAASRTGDFLSIPGDCCQMLEPPAINWRLNVSDNQLE